MFLDKFSALSFAVISGLSFTTAAVAVNPASNGYNFSQEVVFYATKGMGECHNEKKPLLGAHALIGIDTDACL